MTTSPMPGWLWWYVMGMACSAGSEARPLPLSGPRDMRYRGQERGHALGVI